MKPPRSLYARPVIVRGEQCAEARLGPRSDTKQLLGCQAANAGPTGEGSACPGGPPCGRGDRGCPNAFRAVRPFPCPHRFRFGWRARWRGRCPAGHGRACAVRNLSDRGVHRGRRTRPRGHWTGTRLADVPARLGLAEGGHAHCRLSGQGQDEQAAWLAVAGWLGAWSGAGRWRCPPLGRRRPDRSVPIG
jgi:hypothetical protein